MHDPAVLPVHLPVPADDGSADHLPGSAVPGLTLPSTRGGTERVDLVPDGFLRRVVFVYPRTGRPGERPPVQEWDDIPGARGCTPEACGFRDHWEDLRQAGAYVVGLSVQDIAYQQEAAERLALPFPLLSDVDRQLSTALRLPSFEVAETRLLKRLTLVIRDRRVEHVFYPVFPPDSHAVEVLAWLRRQEAR